MLDYVPEKTGNYLESTKKLPGNYREITRIILGMLWESMKNKWEITLNIHRKYRNITRQVPGKYRESTQESFESNGKV